jgi:protein-disulfide isomerase
VAPTLLTPPVEALDHVRGNADAPLELVMFGDFQCPYCLASQSVVRRVRDRIGDDLRFAFRHFPIRERHPMAQAAAEASESAAAQGRFWEYYDAVYDAQQRLSDEELFRIADALGLSGRRVADELAEGRWRDRVERDVRSGEDSGVPGTPTFFVNGRRHDDVFDAGTLTAALTG